MWTRLKREYINFKMTAYLRTKRLPSTTVSQQYPVDLYHFLPSTTVPHQYLLIYTTSYPPPLSHRTLSLRRGTDKKSNHSLKYGTVFDSTGLKPMVDVISFMGRKNLFLRRRRVRNRFFATISLVRNLSNHFRLPMLNLNSFLGTDPV